MKASKLFNVCKTFFIVTILIFSTSCNFNSNDGNDNKEKELEKVEPIEFKLYCKEDVEQNGYLLIHIFGSDEYNPNNCMAKGRYVNNLNTTIPFNSFNFDEENIGNHLRIISGSLLGFDELIIKKMQDDYLLFNEDIYPVNAPKDTILHFSRTPYTSSGLGSSDYSSVKGTYTYTKQNGSTETSGSITLKDDGNWQYNGSKDGVPCKNGTYSVSGSKITVNYSITSSVNSSDDFIISTSGSSVTWTYDGIKSPLLGSLFGVTTNTVTFTKE